MIFMGYNGAIEVLYNNANFSFSQSLSFNLSHNFAPTINFFDIDLDGAADFVTSDDKDIQYRAILQDGTFGNAKNFNVGIGSVRAVFCRDVIGEAFPDIVVMSGFGRTKIFSDKLNAMLQFTTTEKVYDAQAMANFYQVTPNNVATTVSYSGFPSAPRDAGSYDVTIIADDPNYESEPLGGSVSITKKTLTVDVADVSGMQTEAIPPFTLSYTGFVGTENKSLLEQQPVATVTATPTSDPGQYEITVSGGSDENYTFEYQTGVLTITEFVVTGITENIEVDVFPNPATDRINIAYPQWTFVKMYDVAGRMIFSRKYSDEAISLAGCKPGAYILQVYVNGGKCVQRKVLVN